MNRSARFLFFLCLFLTGIMAAGAPASAPDKKNTAALETATQENAVSADSESAKNQELILNLETRASEMEIQIQEWAEQESASAVGITEFSFTALQGRLSTLRKLQSAWQRHVNALKEYEALQERQALFDEEVKSFTRLTEDPPYSMAFLDGLRDQAALKQMDIDAEKLSLRAYNELAGMEQADIAQAKAALNRVAEQLRLAPQEERAALQFESETAKLQVQASEAEYQAAAMELKRKERQLQLLEGELAFARKKVEMARVQTLFRQEELDEIIKREQGLIESLQSEAAKARDSIDQHRNRMLTAERALARATDPEAQQQAKNDLDHLRRQIDAGRARIAGIEALLEYEDYVQKLWQLRFRIANPALAKVRVDLGEVVQIFHERLAVLDKERDAGERRSISLRSRINTLEQQLAEWKEEQGSKKPTERELESLQENLRLRNRMQLRLVEVITLANRIVEEARILQKERSWVQVGKDWLFTAKETTLLAFDHELGVIGEESITGRKLFYMLAILVVGLVVSRMVTRIIRNYAVNRLKLRSNVVMIVAKLTNYILFLTVVYFALNYVNIPLTIFAFLGGAVALGVGFGAQNLINNFLSGLILMGEQPIRLGDIIEIDGKTGTVTDIGGRSSRLRMFNGYDVIIPNSKVLETSVINWTLTDLKYRVQVDVGVAYDSPTRDVAKLLLYAVSDHGQVLTDPPPKVLLSAFGAHALEFTVYFWLERSANVDGTVITSDIRHRIVRLFREAGIEIAYPQQDVHLKSDTPLQVTFSDNTRNADDNEEAQGRLP
ncbi:MAG TPA: mechanosensitive ion channel [Candidatus Hydrogenedentes bacterium]|nr:MAG: Mechanosensitive channel MscK precursor [Candidatus Hydrogenedentes bacterium ADurb.Bin170]HNZ48416.1 mechanosensitive ion channel [Candidatus Hydrogenedentota bacterium]HOH41508.1 mechanosensitive ion channel [Candidatus Hydrogenedentota bacterium]HQB02937.1 mechanosensitive ion channel [Candidatus Hydrogenedentota bacterium]